MNYYEEGVLNRQVEIVSGEVGYLITKLKSTEGVDPRQAALALTNFEQGLMWATKAIDSIDAEETL